MLQPLPAVCTKISTDTQDSMAMLQPLPAVRTKTDTQGSMAMLQPLLTACLRQFALEFSKYAGQHNHTATFPRPGLLRAMHAGGCGHTWQHKYAAGSLDNEAKGAEL